jgi:hypothetical protein
MSSDNLHESNENTDPENAGTRTLKETIKVLLDNGYEYYKSQSATYKQPKTGKYQAYNKNVDSYYNWEYNNKNDSNILLIFTPTKYFTTSEMQFLYNLGYQPEIFDKTYDGYTIENEGDSQAVFKKKIIGTDIINGKIDTNVVKGLLSVVVQYHSDFDAQNAKKYYTYNEEFGEWVNRTNHNTIAATEFMKSLIRNIQTEKHGGNKTKRTYKRINKRKSVKER